MSNRAVTSIVQPTERVVVAESRSYSVWGMDGVTQVWPNDYESNSTNSRLTFPHTSQANILWADGHVTALRVHGLKASYVYPTWTP